MNTQKISRRSLITQGGALAAAGVVLAACGSESTGLSRVGLSPSTTALPEAHVSDVVLLRTAQSVENLAVAALSDPAMSKGNAATKSAIAVFLNGHRANAAAIAPLIAARGGTARDEQRRAVAGDNGDDRCDERRRVDPLDPAECCDVGIGGCALVGGQLGCDRAVPAGRGQRERRPGRRAGLGAEVRGERLDVRDVVRVDGEEGREVVA